jgi:hypothetical protein
MAGWKIEDAGMTLTEQTTLPTPPEVGSGGIVARASGPVHVTPQGDEIPLYRFYPNYATVWWEDAFQVGTGTAVTISLDSNQMYGYYSALASMPQFTSLEAYTYLRAGTYTMRVLGLRTTNSGIAGFQLYSYPSNTLMYSSPGFDFYGTTLYNFVIEDAVTVTTSGNVKIQVSIPGKNGASSGFFLYLTKISFIL